MSSPSRIAALSPLLVAATAFAQTHHVAPQEKVTRALAVYEYTGDLARPTASRLVPVSLFINGQFEDAGLYLARPVPFALERGDVYSVEEAGQAKGTLSVQRAADFTAGRLLTDQDPIGAWYGFGLFAPLSAPKPGRPLHVSAHPSVIASSEDDGRPHLGTKPSTGDAPAAKTPMGDDPDRPTLQRKPLSDDPTGDSTTGTPPAKSGSSGDSSDTTTSGKSSDTDRPSLRKRSAENTGRRTPPQAGVTAPDRSLNDDPDRPTIRHGKTPTEEDATELKTIPADMRQAAAISDPSNREAHLFAREWDSPSERLDVLARMQALARREAVAYLQTNHLTPGVPTAIPGGAAAISNTPAAAASSSTSLPGSPDHDADAPRLRRTPNGSQTAATVPTPTPAATATATASKPSAAKNATAARARSGSRRAKAGPAAPFVFTSEQLNGYLLSYGGLPTFVYSAQVPTASAVPVYVTVVAQRLPSGELQTALHSITDAAHLDRTPWMRPIDAVDPDASHRASLLFELRAQSSRQFALYRLISAEAQQEFVSAPIE